jgi:hypothetical protein
MFKFEQFSLWEFSYNLLGRHVRLPILPREDRRSESR